MRPLPRERLCFSQICKTPARRPLLTTRERAPRHKIWPTALAFLPCRGRVAAQEYRVRSKYKAADWLNLNGSITIWEGRNNVFQVNDLQHNRAYGISALIQPNEKYGIEIGYDYNDLFSQVLICYISVAAGQPGPGIQACPNVTGLVQQLSTYTNKSNYGYFD